MQAGQSGWKFFPNGSMGVGITAIFGDLGYNTMDWMTESRFGVPVIIVYSFVTQVMLVNLLIAMMGNTYDKVKQNSDQEWKFNRYRLIQDYHSGSDFPPPLNLFYLLYSLRWVCSPKDSNIHLISRNQTEIYEFLEQATKKVVEQDKGKIKMELPAISAVIDKRLQLLSSQRESDRIKLEEIESKMEDRMNKIEELLKSINVTREQNS